MQQGCPLHTHIPAYSQWQGSPSPSTTFYGTPSFLAIASFGVLPLFFPPSVSPSLPSALYLLWSNHFPHSDFSRWYLLQLCSCYHPVHNSIWRETKRKATDPVLFCFIDMGVSPISGSHKLAGDWNHPGSSGNTDAWAPTQADWSTRTEDRLGIGIFFFCLLFLFLFLPWHVVFYLKAHIFQWICLYSVGDSITCQ